MIPCVACSGLGSMRAPWILRDINGGIRQTDWINHACPVCNGAKQVDESLQAVRVDCYRSGRGYGARAYDQDGKLLRQQWDYTEAQVLARMGVGSYEPHTRYRIRLGKSYRLEICGEADTAA